MGNCSTSSNGADSSTNLTTCYDQNSSCCVSMSDNSSSNDTNVYSDPTSLEVALESIFVISIMTASIILNSSIINTLLKSRRLRRNGHNLLILNLAVCDLGTTLGVTMVQLIITMNKGCILRDVPFLCSLTVFVGRFFYFGNFGAIIIIAVHRYLLVVQSNRINVTLTHVYVMITASWTSVTILTIPSITAVFGEVCFDCNIFSCRQKYEDNCILSALGHLYPYLVVVPLMIYCYASIALEIKKSQSTVATFRRRVRRSIRRLASRDTDLGIEEDAEATSSQVRAGIDDHEITPDSQRSQDKHQGMYITDWEEYEKEYQEICYTLRRAGSMLDPPTYPFKQSKFKSKSAVRKRDMRLRSVLGADKLVALAGALIVITTLVCWTPYNILNIKISCSSDNCHTNHMVWVFFRCLTYFNSVLDPVIYSMFNRGLHEALVRDCGCVLQRFSCCHHCGGRRRNRLNLKNK